MLVRTNVDERTKFGGSKKDQTRVCYGKMHGCKDIPVVRTIFSWDERSPYIRASLYMGRNFFKIRNSRTLNFHVVFTCGEASRSLDHNQCYSASSASGEIL